MANIYVKASGSGTSPYDTWAKAATTLKVATDFASAGDVIYAHQESETITVDTTYTLASGGSLYLGSLGAGSAGYITVATGKIATISSPIYGNGVNQGVR